MTAQIEELKGIVHVMIIKVNGRLIRNIQLRLLILVYEKRFSVLKRTMNGDQMLKAPIHNTMMIQI